MKTSIKIGQRSFPTKKEALIHYKYILNSYKFGQSLNDSDFADLLALINYEYQLSLAQFPQDEAISVLNKEKEEQANDDDALIIRDIIVSKVQFNTKCFEIIHNDNSSYYMS